jgi:hypothetical protein
MDTLDSHVLGLLAEIGSMRHVDSFTFRVEGEAVRKWMWQAEVGGKRYGTQLDVAGDVDMRGCVVMTLIYAKETLGKLA